MKPQSVDNFILLNICGGKNKYFCKKGMSPKEIYSNFLNSHWDKSLSYSTVKTWAAKFRGGKKERGGFNL